jgi:hypothetical protein
MFEDNNLPTQGGANNFIDPAGSGDEHSYASAKRKKIILWTVVGVLIIASIALIWWLFVYLSNNKKQVEVPVKDDEPEQVEQVGLGVYLNPTEDIDYSDGVLDNLEGVEYLAFADFYRLNSYESKEFNFENYTLPINIKVDVSNYYDLSRKINLDDQVEDLNEFGFAVIDNPWSDQAIDFYALANSLDERQIPLYISADFVSYYYQNILKTAFKDIEEGVFYQSLWDISRSLYESSRIRYESHLTEIGNVNDRVLEGERLATAFFAVALELLKPSANQIEANNKFASGLFNDQEQKRFSFTVPAYLTDDVLRELTLIRASREQQKSPVLLYDRDYKDFVVPTEYRDNARLHNFYLAAAWLNSVFPLNYRSEDCSDCLLDKDDWRINFIAASLIAQDFSDNQELRNEWARVYKSLAFFKGLRDAWNYVDYRDGFYSLFGEDSNITDLFAENNLEAENNFELFRSRLLERQLLPVQGAYTLNSVDGRRFAGLQFLADFYWPNDFILGNLRYPYVGVYEGSRDMAKNNITACSLQNRNQRCQGSAHDVLSLIYPDWNSEYYLENSNYSAYPEALSALRPLVEEAMSSNLNNYWSSLFLWHNYLTSAELNLPLFLQSGPWYEQMAKSALAAWVDMQLPMDKLSLRTQVDTSGTLSFGGAVLDYAWVEPNLEFFDRLIAHNEMIMGMFQAININERSNLAFNHLRNAHRELLILRDIAIKQANGEVLGEADTQAIRDFAKMYTVDQAGEKSLVWSNDPLKVRVRQFIEAPKLIVVAHPVNGKIVMAVGPIFNHRESK